MHTEHLKIVFFAVFSMWPLPGFQVKGKLLHRRPFCCFLFCCFYTPLFMEKAEGREDHSTVIFVWRGISAKTEEIGFSIMPHSSRSAKFTLWYSAMINCNLTWLGWTVRTSSQNLPSSQHLIGKWQSHPGVRGRPKITRDQKYRIRDTTDVSYFRSESLNHLPTIWANSTMKAASWNDKKKSMKWTCWSLHCQHLQIFKQINAQHVELN